MCIDKIDSKSEVKCDNVNGNSKMSGENKDKDLQMRRVAGGCMVKYRPVISPQGDLIYTIWDKTVRVYSTTTGELIRDMEIHSDSKSFLVGICMDKKSPKVLYGITQDGDLYAWKNGSGLILWKKTFQKFPSPIQVLEIFYDENDEAKLLIIDKMRFYIFSLKDEKIVRHYGVLKCTKGTIKAAVGPPKSNCFVYTVQHQLVAVKLKGQIEDQIVNHLNKSMIYSVAFHPKDDIVAVGDKMGRIVLYEGLFGEKNYAKSIYHWHANSNYPKTIVFTATGLNFYSGGMERVLVKWTVNKPEEKTFLPRLSDTVAHVAISPDNLKLIICTEDNGIQVLNALHQQTAVIQNFSCVSDDGTNEATYPIGLKVNPRTQNLVLNGKVGSLQFFSTYTRSLLYTLDIVMQNINTKEKSNVIYSTRITNAAINSFWLATVECYDDREYSSDTRLKFWSFDDAKQNYVFNTNVESVHNGGVNDIEFNSQTREKDLICATAGKDKCIKIWSLEESENTHQKKFVWMCIGKLAYKNLPVKTISFSQDGSLISAGVGNVLCCWKMDNLKLKCALSVPSCLDGSVNKAVISIPTENKDNISKSDYIAKKKAIVADILEFWKRKDSSKSYLDNIMKDNRERFLRRKIDSNVKDPSELNENERKSIFKRVKMVNELSLVQKMEIFSKCGISCQSFAHVKDKFELKVIKSIEKSNDLKRKVYNQVENLSFGSKYLAKRKMHNYLLRKPKETVLSGFTKFFVQAKSVKKDDFDEEDTCEGTQVMKLAQIQNVIVCKGEFSHLIVVSTENRLFIWNLLTLRLQVSVLLTVDKIVLDPYTNLIAVFTKDRELFVFLPNIPMPLYHRNNMPRIHGAVWVPRRYPKPCSLMVDWQAISQLYFLSINQELYQLVSNEDEETFGPVAAYLNEVSWTSIPNTGFAAMLNNRSTNVNEVTRLASKIGVPGKSSVQEMIDSSAHTMAPVSLLCNDFIKSLLMTDNEKISGKVMKKSTANDEETEESGSDDEDKVNEKILARKTHFDKVKNVNGLNNLDNLDNEGKLRSVLNEKIDLIF